MSSYSKAPWGLSVLSQVTSIFTGITISPSPLGPTTAPGCDEPTSRCQTSPSIWTLGGDKPVIPLSLIHISEPTRLGMISYAVFCLKKKKKKKYNEKTLT